jgi:hypothetical protein
MNGFRNDETRSDEGDTSDEDEAAEEQDGVATDCRNNVSTTLDRI